MKDFKIFKSKCEQEEKLGYLDCTYNVHRKTKSYVIWRCHQCRINKYKYMVKLFELFSYFTFCK